MKSHKLVSVIIVNKNDLGIATTLDHLDQLRHDVPCEVIVVDASDPGQMDDIQLSYPWVKWETYPSSRRRTTPEQRNRGLELAQGDIIAFIDANCIPSPDWLASIRANIDAGKAIVCGPVLDSSLNNLVHYAPSLDEPRYVEGCTTISVGLTRQVIESIGGFDPSFSFGQDVDFFWRAADAGYKIYYDPKISISHDWGPRREQLVRAYSYGLARAHLYEKHWPSRKRQLLHETHVWIYPIFLLGLPLTFIFPYYPLFILIPMVKNLRSNPFGLIAHHLTYGVGVLAGTIKSWPISLPVLHANGPKDQR
jgi:glycosyltransferase involved in cell wall biosynthesis